MKFSVLFRTMLVEVQIQVKQTSAVALAMKVAKTEKNQGGPTAQRKSHLGIIYFIQPTNPGAKISIEFSRMFHLRRG